MIFPLLRVRENPETSFALLPRSEHRIPDEICQLFPVLQKMSQRRGGDLSGGQQQLAITRAMIMRPKVLLTDEPTEEIQPDITQQAAEVIRYLHAGGGMAVALVEQSFGFAYDLGDRFYRGAVSFEHPNPASVATPCNRNHDLTATIAAPLICGASANRSFAFGDVSRAITIAAGVKLKKRATD